MSRTFSLAAVLAAAIALPAVAEDKTTIDPGGSTGPTQTMTDQVQQGAETNNQPPGAAGTGQADSQLSPNAAAEVMPARVDNTSLTTQETLALIDKPVYSSDGKKIGEVVAFQRDSSDKVVGMHADVGGFLGLGQTRVNVTPAQFKVQGDRIVLELTAEQAKNLPKASD
jgi:hypothetical protein